MQTNVPIIQTTPWGEDRAVYPAIYKDFETGRTWEAFSSHPQIDSGLGFTCDHGVLAMIQALHHAGLPTLYSCESVGPWVIRRKEVCFSHARPHALLDCCLFLQATKLEDFDLKIRVDNYCKPPNIHATLSYSLHIENELLNALNSVKWHTSYGL